MRIFHRKSDPQIRPFVIKRDLTKVFKIEKASFEFPWDKEDFGRCLRQKHIDGIVAELPDGIAGFAIYEKYKKRIKVLNFAVSQAHRRRGIGTAMTRALRCELKPPLRNRITLEVRERNLSAQLFWRSQKFRWICTLYDYYEEVEEDAYVMQYTQPTRTLPSGLLSAASSALGNQVVKIYRTKIFGGNIARPHVEKPL